MGSSDPHPSRGREAHLDGSLDPVWSLEFAKIGGKECSWTGVIRDRDVSFMLISPPSSLTRYWDSLEWVPNSDVQLWLWPGFRELRL